MSFPIKGFLETSFVDWPGKVASVVFLPRCNFRCPYCHNHELVLDPDRLPTISFQNILKQINKYKSWIDGVCITGGEPTLFSGLVQLIERFRNEGLLIKLDTNGSCPEVLRELIRDHLVDYVAMDVKAPLNHELYSGCCGVSVDLEKIKESIRLLQEGLPSYEFRVTVVPTLLKKESLLALAHELKGSKKLTLQKFNSARPLDPELKKVKSYTDQEIKELQEEINKILRKDGTPERKPFLSPRK